MHCPLLLSCHGFVVRLEFIGERKRVSLYEFVQMRDYVQIGMGFCASLIGVDRYMSVRVYASIDVVCFEARFR